MRRQSVTLVLAASVVCFLLLGTGPAGAAEPPVLSPAEAVALGGQSDGARITVRGEALGEVLRDGGGGSWLNVLGDGTAIGLWGERELFDVVDEFGDYHQRGQVVQATGIYNAACNQHGGDRDVHVTSVRVVAPAEPIERQFHWWKVIGGGVMLALAAALWYWRKRHADWSFWLTAGRAPRG